MPKCIICKKKEATIRDREKPWSKHKKICIGCHALRLTNDLIYILEVEKRRTKCLKVSK